MQRGFQAWAQGDVAGVLEAIDDNAVTRPIIGPDWHGPQGYLDMVADWVEGFDQWTITPEEFIDAGDDVVVRVRQEGRGASTGVPVEVIFWFVYTIKDAKIVRCEMFQDREPALEAAGLSERDAHADS
jgi:ketosteroid isomerase-like protein